MVDEFEQAMVEVVRRAKASGKVCYLYKTTHYWLSHQYWNDWLFKAYPGGRKVLSLKGKAHAVATAQVVGEG